MTATLQKICARVGPNDGKNANSNKGQVMTDDTTIEQEAREFVQRAHAYRDRLRTDVITSTVQEALETWATDFTERLGVPPSREQRTQKESAERGRVADELAAEDAHLESEYQRLHKSYTDAGQGFQQLPDALERTYATQREAKQVPGLSRTDELLTRLLDHHETQALEVKLAGKSFDELDVLHEGAVRRGDVPLQRIIESRWQDRWPTVTPTPEGLSARLRLERRIQDEREKRVPPSVRNAIAALDQAWTSATFSDLRKIMRGQRFKVAG